APFRRCGPADGEVAPGDADALGASHQAVGRDHAVSDTTIPPEQTGKPLPSLAHATAETGEEAFDLLDSYVEQLRSGAANRAAWRRDHPTLAGILDCLDALEADASADSGLMLGRVADPADFVTASFGVESTPARGGALPRREFGDYELLD